MTGFVTLFIEMSLYMYENMITYLTCCCALLLMVKFCARLARLLSKSPVKTLPVAAVLTGCPVAEIILIQNQFIHHHIGIKKLSKILSNIYVEQSSPKNQMRI